MHTPMTVEQGPSEKIEGIAVLIPAWQPEPRLVTLIRSLLESIVGAIIVVDDGSGEDCTGIFQELTLLPRVHVLRHGVNLGKGRALKTGINYCLTELPDIRGIVTADADGQHTVADIVRVAEAMLAGEGSVVLGAREFAKDVPLRSKLGNVMTRHVFGFVTGTKIVDTQTGLRAFPRPLWRELMVVDGERYEYEMSVLAHVCRTGGKPLEVAIETVYIDGNKSSHFDPIWDSMRIYFVLVRFYFSSFISALLDLVGFSVALWFTHSVLIAVVVGRLNSLINFALNRRFVFHNRASIKGALWRYYLLVAVLGLISYGSILGLSHLLGWNVLAIKILVETLLSVVSFSVQRTFVFRGGSSDRNGPPA
jgi:glycosyltransferase involved in cell wall biosynthesis